MGISSPCRSTGREIAELVVETALGSVPLVGAAMGVTFVTARGWRLGQRRAKWFTHVAKGVQELPARGANVDPGSGSHEIGRGYSAGAIRPRAARIRGDSALSPPHSPVTAASWGHRAR
jgi:hypothetical protein